MSDRAQPQPRVGEVVAIAPSPHEGDESVLVAALDTGSHGRRRRALGAAAVGLVAIAALLIQDTGPGPAGSEQQSAITTVGQTNIALQSPRDGFQSRYTLQTQPPRVPALYGMEEWQPVPRSVC